jgi:hypothetical protein
MAQPLIVTRDLSSIQTGSRKFASQNLELET